MTDAATQVQQFREYARLIESMLPAAPGAFAPELEAATSVQVERGGVFAVALRDPSAPTTSLSPWVERLIELSSPDAIARVAVIDRGGHQRPLYRGLLVYAWLQTFRTVYETLPRGEFGRWEEALRAWADAAEAQLGELALPAGGEPVPAARGAPATEAAWIALALWVAGKVYVRDAWTDLAADTFGRLVRAQQRTGAFLKAEPSDNPEPWWYHELTILHAAASYAVQAEDRHVAAAVARAATFHQNETQPDHATTQPWGVFAFIWNPDTRPLADQLFHAQSVQHPAGVSGVPLMLLGDALYCLRLFL
jgi:hypothetical protein